ncbi:hypothetical protein HW509_14415 [Asaia spathodeae]|uniref:hypothetical protein n=1 Tax=Asaia spathodeae TaxID=657016 RepID=UPI002FC32F4A
MSNADFQLSLFGDTALDGNANLFWGELEGEEGDAPGAALPAVEPLVIPQTDFRLAGLRGLAQGWKARARDNIEAIKLVSTLEREARNATSEEQAQLSRFTGFGAGELANALFPRADEAYRAGWEKLGADLEACTTEAERSALARSTQYVLIFTEN